MGKINNALKQYVRNWLNVREASNEHSITIDKAFTNRTKAFENLIWYTGDASELHQFYTMTDDTVGNTLFWKADTTGKLKFRKIHSGLPKLIVDKLVDITIDDLNDLEFKVALNAVAWGLIVKDLNFNELLKDAVTRALVTGDGAFKISVDTEISPHPIIEFYDAKDVAYDYNRGILTAIRFYTTHIIKDIPYRVEEIYSKHGIEYHVYDHSGDDVTIPMIEEIGMQSLFYNQELMMAVPLKFISGINGRGRSIFEGKLQVFDSFDEIWSTWMDEVRTGRTKTYIPENFIPRDPLTGVILSPNSFENRFVQLAADMGENAKNEIKNVGGMVNTNDLIQSYMTALDLCLQGIISPATLGIDVKKLDNAEAQREKEKTTLYTRNKITKALEYTIPKLVEIVMQVQLLIDGQAISDNIEVAATFGEYASPSFDSQVQTIAAARSAGIMSLEKALKELYGSSLKESEIKEEIEKIQNEDSMSEPSVVEEDMYGGSI